MTVNRPSRPARRLAGPLAVAAATALLAAGCASAGTAGTAQSGGGGSAPVKVGLLYSRTGLLAAYGKQYEQGFQAGLAYATHGTGTVNGHRIDVVEQDDTGDPATAVADAKDLIGKGVKVLAGTTDSGIGLQLAPLAAQNQILYISGPAATDALTGANKYTFRSGRESYQDIAAAGSFVGDPSGKKVLVLAQDSAFGQANVAAVKAVLGPKGASVSQVLAPPSATDLTPFAQQVRSAKADLVYVAWAGATASALWTALDQQGVLGSTKVVTGLAGTASYPIFGSAGSKGSRGRIALDGADITRLAPHARARRGLGRTFQTSSLWPGMTVADHVRLAAQAAQGGSFQLWRRARSFTDEVTATLERTGLADRAEALAGSLSHGEKRKLELAVLLVGDPRVMLLDEPMAGVSAEEVPALTELIRSLHRDEGRTVMMVEHHMDVLLGLADRLAVMHHGTLLALDVPDTVMADETVQLAYLGEGL